MGNALCQTTLNYLPAAPSPTAATREVTIENGRAADLPGWETCGFELRRHESAVRDWDDDDEIRTVHYPEVVALARQMTGSDHALLASHIKRNPQRAAEHGDLAPITLVHSDFADSYGDLIRQRYRSPGPDEQAAMDHAGVDGRAVESARRIVVLQFWRNLGAEKMDLPLAFCDARTVPRDDVRPFPVTNYAGGGFDFDAMGVVAPDDIGRHRWYGFDCMTRDEVVAFRTFDTDRVPTGEPYWTPHSAYRDPDVELGRPSRSSIELRAICLFG